MRFRGSKQAALYREHGPARLDFLEEFLYRCAVCGCARPDTAVHEIPNGLNRMRAFGVRAAWLPACSVCNCGPLTDDNDWPLARQLALKLLIDPVHFDLQEIRRIFAPEGCKNPPVRVTEADILPHLQQLLIDRLGESP